MSNNLKVRAARGGIYMASITFALRPVSMGLAILLARLLGPKDFGLRALAMILVNAANYFTDMGMRPTVVQTKEDINKVAHYAFVIVMVTIALVGQQCPILVEAGSSREKAALRVSLGGVACIVGKIVNGALRARCDPNWVGGVTLSSARLASVLLLEDIRPPSLIVVAMVIGKYSDHLPLYRQESMLLREAGVEISRATMTGWLMEIGEICLLYTSPSPRDRTRSRMPSSAWKKKTLR